MRRPRDKGNKADCGNPPKSQGHKEDKTMNRTAKNDYTIKAELVSDPVDEWMEWRVYKGKKRVASLPTEKEAKAYVKKAA